VRVEASDAIAGVGGVYAPGIEEALVHLGGCDPFVFVVIDGILRGVHEVVEEEGVGGVGEVGEELAAALYVVPLHEVELYAHIDGLGAGVAGGVRGGDGGELPHAVEVAVHGHLVAGGEEEGKEDKGEGKGAAANTPHTRHEGDGRGEGEVWVLQ